MYVYMFKILRNGGNIDLILRLQRFNAVRKKNNLEQYSKFKKNHIMKTGFLCRGVTYAHL